MTRKKMLNLPDEVRAFFSAASAKRERVNKACAWCEEPMSGVLKKRLYCSRRCHDQAAYDRRKDRARQQPPEAQP